ncbi:hypothetical protein EV44_g5463 [Erysiphe necator]|uniref:Uncharacterized protein n=1 Tax=Uncinula necator TaxID=52586 RepID=A0A0B1PDN1_UNCNE|nr:hypothetical protein EV44_g5463 [Erysiphe necator]
MFVVEINSIGAEILGRVEPTANERLNVLLLVGPEDSGSEDFLDRITVRARASDILNSDEYVYRRLFLDNMVKYY